MSKPRRPRSRHRRRQRKKTIQKGGSTTNQQWINAIYYKRKPNPRTGRIEGTMDGCTLM